MSDFHSFRIDETTKVLHTQGKTYLVYEGKDWDGNPETNKIEIKNIGMAILALQDLISAKAREW